MAAMRPSNEIGLVRPRPQTGARGGLRRTTFAVLALVVVPLTLAMPSIASGVTWTGQGDGTSWDHGKNWSSNQVPERDDEVTIGPQPPGNVKLNGNRRVKGLTLHTGGYIDGHKQVGGRSVLSHRLTISDHLTWTGGEINSHATLKAGSESKISGPNTKSLGAGSNRGERRHAHVRGRRQDGEPLA
jgi:hypothetical protein